MAPAHQSCSVHLVGSIPLESSEKVFRTASAILGDRLCRLPDGETGSRSDWIGWQFAVMEKTPHLETVPPVPGRYAARPHVKLETNSDPNKVVFGSLGYAEAAIASYTIFSRLKQEEVIPAQYRFQVCLPTPLAVITAFVNRADRIVIEPIYEKRLLTELNEISASIPHDQLAIQWDMPFEIGIMEGVIPSHLDDARREIIARIARISVQVPRDADLGYHLCYGDVGHQHFKQPFDSTILVELANEISSSVQRPINWLHMPVPRDRSDDAYFMPLRNIKLHAETQLFLGLVHYTDGLEGTLRRVEAARRTIPDFGIATECGFGRRPTETVVKLLEIHAEAADSLDLTDAGGLG